MLEVEFALLIRLQAARNRFESGACIAWSEKKGDKEMETERLTEVRRSLSKGVSSLVTVHGFLDSFSTSAKLTMDSEWPEENRLQCTSRFCTTKWNPSVKNDALLSTSKTESEPLGENSRRKLGDPR